MKEEAMSEPHPGEWHEWRTTCVRCGEPGMLNVSIIGPDERVRIAPFDRLDPHVPTPGELDSLLSDVSSAGYASEATEIVENWTRKHWGVESAFTSKMARESQP